MLSTALPVSDVEVIEVIIALVNVNMNHTFLL